MPDAQVFPLYLAELSLPEEEEWPADSPFPIVAHAVTHRDGVFLLDTGIGTGNQEVDDLFSPVRFPLENALAKHGIEMTDVTAVANCHLHLDHSGQNGLFTGRPIFVQRREWAMVHEPDYTVADWVDIPGLSYEVVEGDVNVAPGLRLFSTPGHSPGHQSLVVDTADGTVLITGQAVETLGEWDGRDDAVSGEPKPGEEARDDYLASVTTLRALNPVRVHFVHDPGVWTRDR